MKKNNKIKKSVSMLAFLFVCALSVILSSCSDELDIQQSYPFKVETMPVPKDIVRGQTVEIRCELKAEGKFDGTIYTIRYFQHAGKDGRENRSGDVSISVMIPIIPMLKRGCAFAEGKGFLERQCADSCDGP